MEAARVAHLATADADAAPHVVPVCFALGRRQVYITIDAKPKATATRLRRLQNLAANPQAALVVDHYDEDWSRLGWVMVRGPARILAGGAEHDAAQAMLRARYPQYRSMALAELPVIAIDMARVVVWGAIGGAIGGAITGSV